MNSYVPVRPRATIALCAMALTVLTISLLVVAPAKFDAANPDARTLAASRVAPSAPTVVAISPARTDVIGVRQAEIASAGMNLPVGAPGAGAYFAA